MDKFIFITTPRTQSVLKPRIIWMVCTIELVADFVGIVIRGVIIKTHSMGLQFETNKPSLIGAVE